MQCCAHKPENRPSMEAVFNQLEQAVQIQKAYAVEAEKVQLSSTMTLSCFFTLTNKHLDKNKYHASLHIGDYLNRRDRQAMRCVNRDSYRFFNQAHDDRMQWAEEDKQTHQRLALV